jgi:hypothetical protein
MICKARPAVNSLRPCSPSARFRAKSARHLDCRLRRSRVIWPKAWLLSDSLSDRMHRARTGKLHLTRQLQAGAGEASSLPAGSAAEEIMWQSRIHRIALVNLLLLAFALPGLAQSEKHKEKQKKSMPVGTPVFWRDPGAIERRNLLLGAGGEAMKPDLRKVTFIEKKKGGTSTKYRVKDASGNEWVAKLGKEAQPDTSANRLLWAVGYETEIAYLIPRLTIEGKGSFENVRLEARPKNVDRIGNWEWENNPFTGTPQFQGLKVMMVLINNWDIKDSNNEILAAKQGAGLGELRYIISDLGGSFGKTGGFFARTRNKPSDFVKSDFIEAVKGEVIDFNYGGKSQKLFADITTSDAKWISSLLSRLTDEQIKDAFRAANYPPEEVERLSQAVRQRIGELNNVSGQVASRP